MTAADPTPDATPETASATADDTTGHSTDAATTVDPADQTDASTAIATADSTVAATDTDSSGKNQKTDADDKTTQNSDQAAIASAQAAVASASNSANPAAVHLNVKLGGNASNMDPGDQALVQEVAAKLKMLVALVKMHLHQEQGKNKDLKSADDAIADAQRSAGSSSIQDAVSIPSLNVNVAVADSKAA